MGDKRSRTVALGMNNLLALEDGSFPNALVEEEEYKTELEYLQELSDMGYDDITDILKAQGFDGLPRAMTKEEFDKFVADGGVELARGILANSQEQYDKYTDSLLNGDFYVCSEKDGYFGSGLYTYAGKSLDQAENYGEVTRLALSPNAKIYEVDFTAKDVKLQKGFSKSNYDDYFDAVDGDIDSARALKIPNFISTQGIKSEKEMNKTIAHNSKVTRKYFKETLSKKDFKILYKNSIEVDVSPSSEVLAAKGYDAVRFTPAYVREYSGNGSHEIMIVLNRSKLVVQR